MKRNITNKAIMGFLGASVLLGAPSCSDDHYDIKPGLESASRTLWQNIENTQELDSLAQILKRIKVYTKEDDKNRSMTYADLLSSPQSYTFWAPINGTYNAKYYLDQIDSIDALVLRGEVEKANKMEYTLGVQFAQNHLARFNYESNAGAQEVRLYNGKLCTYDAAKGAFNGIPLNAAFKNVPSTNGSMHVIDGVSPFAYNIYDHMAAHAVQFGQVYGTLSDPDIDKKTFSEELSVPGAMNELGQMVYVDSVFISNNELLSQSNALIKNEDSLYIATIPTDAAWDEAFDKVSQLFKYGKTYNYDYSDKTTTFASTLKLDADSLLDYNTRKALITSMYFSPSMMGDGNFERDQTEEIVDYAYYADSLISTNGVIYYNNSDSVGGKLGKNPVFGKVDYVKASNGIIFPLDSYDVDPSYSFIHRQELDMYNVYTIGDVQGSSNGRKGTAYELVEDRNWDTEINLDGLENKRYRYFEAQGDLNIYIPLPRLYSGKYCIKVQILPNRADFDHKWYDKKTGEEVMQKSRFFAQLKDDMGKPIGSKTHDVYVDDDSVMTYTLWESIEIPKCYVGLPAGIEKCYPLLQLQMPRRYQKKPGNVNAATFGLSLLKVIIEPVHE